jgi:hypothetical protein
MKCLSTTYPEEVINAARRNANISDHHRCVQWWKQPRHPIKKIIPNNTYLILTSFYEKLKSEMMRIRCKQHRAHQNAFFWRKAPKNSQKGTESKMGFLNVVQTLKLTAWKVTNIFIFSINCLSLLAADNRSIVITDHCCWCRRHEPLTTMIAESRKPQGEPSSWAHATAVSSIKRSFHISQQAFNFLRVLVRLGITNNSRHMSTTLTDTFSSLRERKDTNTVTTRAAAGRTLTA